PKTITPILSSEFSKGAARKIHRANGRIEPDRSARFAHACIEFVIFVRQKSLIKRANSLDQLPAKRTEWDGIHRSRLGIEAIHRITHSQRMRRRKRNRLRHPRLCARADLPHAAHIISLS